MGEYARSILLKIRDDFRNTSEIFSSHFNSMEPRLICLYLKLLVLYIFHETLLPFLGMDGERQREKGESRLDYAWEKERRESKREGCQPVFFPTCMCTCMGEKVG